MGKEITAKEELLARRIQLELSGGVHSQEFRSLLQQEIAERVNHKLAHLLGVEGVTDDEKAILVTAVGNYQAAIMYKAKEYNSHPSQVASSVAGNIYGSYSDELVTKILNSRQQRQIRQQPDASGVKSENSRKIKMSR